jgi:hypothetical protein
MRAMPGNDVGIGWRSALNLKNLRHHRSNFCPPANIQQKPSHA